MTDSDSFSFYCYTKVPLKMATDWSLTLKGNEIKFIGPRIILVELRSSITVLMTSYCNRYGCHPVEEVSQT